VPSKRLDNVVRHGYFKGKTFREAFVENPAYCKWEMRNGLSAKNPEFASFLESRAKLNVAFHDVDPVEPPPPPPPPPPPKPLPPPPPPDYTKLYRDFKVGFGKHKGKTFAQLVKEDPDYCLWVARNEDFYGTPLYTYLNARLKK
jgi:hypothetical protein